MPRMLCLLQRACVVGCDVEESVGLELLGIVAGEAEFGHAIDEGGVGGEEGVAAKFPIWTVPVHVNVPASAASVAVRCAPSLLRSARVMPVKRLIDSLLKLDAAVLVARGSQYH